MKEERWTLGAIAHARSGDKGSNANIGVIAYSEKGYRFLEQYLTKERVVHFFSALNLQSVKRYELPNLGALNFILEGVLSGGGSRSLRIDAQGKALGQAILEMPLELSLAELRVLGVNDERLSLYYL